MTAPSPATLPRALLLGLLALLAGACHSGRLSAEERERRIEVHTQSAALYLRMGEYERAIDQTQRGLDLDPENFDLRLLLGRALQMRGTTQDVLAAEKVYRSLPGDEDFRVPLGLAEALERKGTAFSETSEAILSGKRFTEAPDPEARARELRDKAQAAWEEALAAYRRALELQPGDTEVLSGLARVTALLGRHEESLGWGERVLATIDEDRAFWQQRLARPDLDAGTEADYKRRIARLENLEIAVRLQRAAIFRTLERDPQALAEIETVLEFDPDRPELWSRRAQLLARLGRFEEAIESIERFLAKSQLEFDHPDVREAYRLKAIWERRAASSVPVGPAGGDGGRSDGAPERSGGR